MGNCMGCCPDSGPKPTPNTARDDEARMIAAQRAEQRQTNFEQSAVGKAAYKSVQNAAKPANNSSAPDNSRDWLS